MNDGLKALEARLSLGKGVRVVAAHPCGLIGLEKPVGTLSHPNQPGEKKRSLILADYDYKARRFYKLEGRDSFEEVFLVNRLDSATSGVLLVCTNKQLMPQIISSFEKNRVKKTYNAIVQGRPRTQPLVWTDTVRVTAGPSRGRRVQGEGQLLAKTEQYIMKSDANLLGLSLMRLMPLTGRTHQLRYQCTKRGHPILGDANYGDYKLNKHFSKLAYARRLFLHACAIEIPLIVEEKKVDFRAESKLPSAFDQLMSPNKEAKAISRFAASPRLIAAEQRKRFGRTKSGF